MTYKKLKDRTEIPSSLPYSEDTGILASPLAVKNKNIPNRIVYQPMEGCDGTGDGAPDTLTRRRYLRFATGGAGLIWFEATAVVPEGRANPRQLWLTEDNAGSFAALITEIKETCLKENGYEPIIVCQLTHSGRHSKPKGYPEPLIAANKPIFEGSTPLPPECVLSDSYLDTLPDVYAKVAALARHVGFDGVDVKACHGYLLSELLSAYERKGKYGGTFENRTRLLCDAVSAVRAALDSNMLLCSRLNAYDGYPYPYGFGDSGKPGVPDLSEAIRLCGELAARGLDIVNITMGNPYYNNEVNRPTVFAKEVPPTESAVRMIDGAARISAAVPSLAVVSSGWSFFDALAANVAAGMVGSGMFPLVGFGRQTFCYPNLARDIVMRKGMGTSRLCLTCGKCTELMRAGSTPGCVIYDKETYLNLYREVIKK